MNDRITLDLIDGLPSEITFDPKYRRAPKRELLLNEREIKLALKNALRYIPVQFHETMAPEFMEELMSMGRIYGYRFRPEGKIYAKPVDEYRGDAWKARRFS